MALKLTKRDLHNYDLELLLDTSGSMGTADTPSGLTRLDDSKKLITLLIQEMAEYDDDGITIGYFDTSLHQVHENTTVETAKAVLQKARATGGGTNTHQAVGARIEAYFERRFGKAKQGVFGKAVPANPNCKPVIIVVVTDGEPNDQAALERVIVDATKRLTAERLTRDVLGISFIQTGGDRNATAALDRLNNGLGARGATMDIVNCLTIDDVAGKTTKEILEAALDD
jgi:uncharacterized protein YegL